MQSLNIETLESRRLLSSATLNGGLLRVLGDAETANNIAITVDGDNIVVNHNGTSDTFAKADVRHVLVRGGAEADTVEVATLGVFVRVMTWAGDDSVTLGDDRFAVFTGDGNDTASIGNGRGVVYGGDGDDGITVGNGGAWIFAGRGNDTVIAGDGRNLIHGGSGNDNITVGNGNNRIFGGAGNDTMTTGSGNDWLFGGSGDDVFNLNGGTKRVFAVIGSDTVNCGSGPDTIWARNADSVTLNNFTDGDDRLITGWWYAPGDGNGRNT